MVACGKNKIMQQLSSMSIIREGDFYKVAQIN